MRACTFFGHRECYRLDVGALYDTIEKLIHQGIHTFYVGNQGQFDGAVYACLKKLRVMYPYIRIAVVLAYLPVKTREGENLSDTMYPEIEGHPKSAIDRRNRWMVDASDCCICYINQSRGGACQFARFAKRQGLKVINLGTLREI